MSEFERSLGGLEARLDEHGKRVDRIELKIDAGFAKLDALIASENRRKGAIATWGKIFIGATGVATIWETAKAFLIHR